MMEIKSRHFHVFHYFHDTPGSDGHLKLRVMSSVPSSYGPNFKRTNLHVSFLSKLIMVCTHSLVVIYFLIIHYLIFNVH